MTLFLLAYSAGVLTVVTPCILPILPFVLVRADKPFRQGAFPMLLGLALAFAAVASLASFAGGWAVTLNRDGRTVALMMITLFGLSMLLPNLTARVAAPIVSIGSRLGTWVERRTAGKDPALVYSALFGVATGFVWTPCAGAILGLVLTTAALTGPSIRTSLLLLTYGLGAATSLAVCSFLGGRLIAALRRSGRWVDGFHRIVGAAVVVGAALIWLGYSNGWSAHLRQPKKVQGIGVSVSRVIHSGSFSARDTNE